MNLLDTISLKQYIYDQKKIEFVLEQIGCHHIQYHPHKNYYSCGNYNGDNIGAINVYNNPYLGVNNWTRQQDFEEHSDIFTLVSYNKKLDFPETVKYLHSVLGLEYKWAKPIIKRSVDDPLYVFKKYKYGHFNVKEIETLQENLVEHYVPILHESWYREGICPWTRDKFDICYSFKRKRVIIPMRYWNTGELLGFNARTVIDNYEELGIKKYYITPTYPKSKNLYGLYENKEDIIKAGYIVIYESERSVLKRDSRNDPTGIALSGHTISDEQVAIIRGLASSNNLKIIISMDKDISINEVRFICSKFLGLNVYYTWDKWNLLGEKDSVADSSKKVFDFIMRHKIKYNDIEHQKYLAWKNDK